MQNPGMEQRHGWYSSGKRRREANKWVLLLLLLGLTLCRQRVDWLVVQIVRAIGRPYRLVPQQ